MLSQFYIHHSVCILEKTNNQNLYVAKTKLFKYDIYFISNGLLYILILCIETITNSYNIKKVIAC